MSLTIELRCSFHPAMSTSHAVRRLGAVGWIAAPIAAVALTGCTVRTGIRPDSLPGVLMAAERNPHAPVMSAGEGNFEVQTQGRLDAVVVTRSGPNQVRNRFEGPVRARLDGVALMVWNRGTLESYAIDDIARVVVERYDHPGAVKAGVVLTVVGAAATFGGSLLFAQVGHAHDGLPFFGIPIMTVGLGLGAGGIPLIIAGKREPERWIAGGPGGIGIRF